MKTKLYQSPQIEVNAFLSQLQIMDGSPIGSNANLKDGGDGSGSEARVPLRYLIP